MEEKLTDKQRKYVEGLARGLDSRAAARDAGYSESFSRVAAHRLQKKAVIAKAIEEIRRQGRDMAAYGLVEAMAQAQKGIDLAERHHNAMAFIKGTELRAKLSGLLVDKVEVVSVDLRKALELAEARIAGVIDVTPPLFNGELIQAPDSSYYNGPGRKGNPFAD